MNLILPKKFVDIATIGKLPMFYVAGPILGGGNWQEKCCLELKKCLADFFAVVPCNWGYGAKLFRHAVDGKTDRFPDQTRWERYYLKLANDLSIRRRGCIIFWLPRESQDSPRNDGNPYAIDTLGEIARWGKDASLRNGHIIVGAEEGFKRLRGIRTNLTDDFDFPSGREFPIHPTLEETVLHAMQLVI